MAIEYPGIEPQGTHVKLLMKNKYLKKEVFSTYLMWSSKKTQEYIGGICTDDFS